MSTTLYALDMVLHRFNIFLFLLCSVLLQNYLSHASSNQSHPQIIRCHEDDRSALMEFKQSLMNTDTSCNSYNICTEFRKLDTWTVQKEFDDCCTWEGISCNATTGRVIGLDLSATCACASSIHSGSSLVRLNHLQELNIATVDFQYTPAIVPSIISKLSSTLRSLNLSMCNLQGELSIAVFEPLPKLERLDLSDNDQLGGDFFPDYFNRSSSSLTVLSLAMTKFSGELPAYLPDSLIRLDISWCNFRGLIPSSVSNLTRLTLLDLGDNYFHGQIPPLSAAGLEVLVLAENLFDGEIPSSIGNLARLSKLDLHGNHLTGPILDLTDLTLLHTLDLSKNRLTGPIPLSIGNLKQLRDLDLSSNYRITGPIPPSLAEQLVGLNLGFNQLTGTIPHSIDNLKNLRLLHLGSNKLTGPIPSQLGNLTLLENLFLFSNRLSGPFPVIDIARLTKLTTLSLASNNLNGQLKFNFFVHNFPNLANLDLSFNELSVVFDEPISSITSHDQYNKFTDLRLGSCNLSEFPHVLESPDWELTTLDLSYNSLSGRVPAWFLSVSSTSLSTLNLSGNSLTGFSQDPVFFNWTSLDFLDLSSNELQGSLPIPPASIKTYIASNNSLSGEIPPSLCNLTDIRRLDLANNNFGGVIPQCLAILTSKLLSVLILRGNHLYGPIPDYLSNNNRVCSLRMIDVSDNQLQGPLPRSLSSCTELRFLNLRSNGIVDAFPSWLGSLSNLKVLILSSNRFHGAIGKPEDGYLFPKLQVIDISRNNFGGFLPSKYFQNWNNATRDIFDEDGDEYIGELTIQSSGTFLQYDYSMTIINKGMEMEYGKILNYFIAIDLSGNNFIGEIPASVGRVKGLRLLNLSNNAFTGHIPAFLKDLTHLEALDLSRNDLSGDIPQQLTQLSYLSFFNVSYNRLSGRIPRGNQFNTFRNDSYIGNLGLCGEPLSEECGARTTPPSDEAEGSYFELEWPIIVMGVVSGLVIGVAMGLIVPIRRNNWFVWKISEFVRARLAR